jgi:phenylacetate-CoA ligase
MAKGLPGIVWPPLNALGPAGIRELLSHFEDSQWLTPEALQARQFRQLGVLVEHARATVPFYRRRLAGTGVEPGGLDMEAWLAIPTLKRRELQEEGEALSSRRPLAKHGRASTVTTSGSTGMPVTVHRSALSGTFWHAVTARDHLWHGRDVGTKLAAIRVTENPKAHAPAGAHGRGWGRAARTLGPPGPVALIDIGRPVPQQLDWLRHEDPDYLITYPSNLAALLRESRAEGTRLVRLRQAMTISEALSPGLREACREVWGVEIADTYSNQEHGALALQCPDHTHYHVQSEAVLLEVLDEGGRPCGPGEVGRVVITPLHAFAMPLIRYEVGDYAEVGPPCACGRGLPVIARVLGRVRNCLRAPSGEVFWPKVGEMFFRRIAPIAQYQVVQTSYERVEITFVAERLPTAEEEDEIRRKFRGRIGYPFEVDFRYVEAIPRSPGGKYEDVICAIEDGAGSS